MTMLTGFDEVQVTEFFSYLDALRLSGVTNMFRAAPYLAREFELGRDEARKVLTAWMQTYNCERSPEHRAKTALPA